MGQEVFYLIRSIDRTKFSSLLIAFIATNNKTHSIIEHAINTKFIKGDWTGLHHGEFRYYDELQHKFHDLWRVLLYVISFFFLSLHLLHGFQSSFQSVGVRTSTITPVIKKISTFYAILVPAGFVFIAIYHYLTYVIINL